MGPRQYSAKTKLCYTSVVLNVRQYKLISDQVEYDELVVIIRELERVLAKNVLGDIVELGCYTGTTSLFIQRVLLDTKSDRSFHAYDSFEGLPPKVSADMSTVGEQFVAGELLASKQQFIKHFKQANLQLPIIHKCWFEELTISDVPSKIAFAFLDGDFYTSIASSLAVITPSLTPGSVIVVDDYHSEALPGAKKATDEWARKHRQTVTHTHSVAVIHWKKIY